MFVLKISREFGSEIDKLLMGYDSIIAEAVYVPADWKEQNTTGLFYTTVVLNDNGFYIKINPRLHFLLTLSSFTFKRFRFVIDYFVQHLHVKLWQMSATQ